MNLRKYLRSSLVSNVHEFFGLCPIQAEDLHSTIFHIIIFPYMIIQGLSYEEIAFIFEPANTLLIRIHLFRYFYIGCYVEGC